MSLHKKEVASFWDFESKLTCHGEMGYKANGR